MSTPRPVWHALALVATLALATVVAVVAVTRTDRPEATPTPSPSGSASATGSPSPGVLDGRGPYVVVAAADGTVRAYDVAAGSSTVLGRIEGRPVDRRSAQPGGGRIVAFPTADGVLWRVTRRGLARLGSILPSAGRTFEGAAVSPDDRRLATAALTPEPALVLVDLASGRSTVVERRRADDLPDEPMLPVGWSLGGTIVYQIPFCRCAEGARGLWATDLETGGTSVVPQTRETRLDRFAMTPEGQTILYGTATARRCRAGERAPCEGPPFSLRRLAAGRSGVEALIRSTRAAMTAAALSPDGRLLVLARRDAVSGAATYAIVEAESGDEGAGAVLRGVPDGADPLALLPGDALVAAVERPGGRAIIVIRDGVASEVAPEAGTGAAFLGWLR